MGTTRSSSITAVIPPMVSDVFFPNTFFKFVLVAQMFAESLGLCLALNY